jgi:hypothetical protein
VDRADTAMRAHVRYGSIEVAGRIDTMAAPEMARTAARARCAMMMMMMMIGLLLAICAAQPQGNVDRAEPVRVYVFTAPPASGKPPEEQKGRADAVRELEDNLRKKKGLTIVDQRSDATVLVEVVGREERDVGMGGFGGKTVTPMGDTIIRVHVTEGTADADLKGMAQGTWGRAAKDAADRIAKWIGRQSRGSDKPPSTLMMLPVA